MSTRRSGALRPDIGFAKIEIQLSNLRLHVRTKGRSSEAIHGWRTMGLENQGAREALEAKTATLLDLAGQCRTLNF